MHPTDLPLCDIVMKGGVTSGLVYPRLASRLARDYRFKNIGGTSAGAIAAAACAAAELGRQSGRRPDAFDAFDRLPGQLGERSAGRSRLVNLFQPTAAAARAFHLLLALVSAPDRRAAALAVLLRLAGAVRWPLLLLVCTTVATRAVTGKPWLAVAISQVIALVAAGLAAGGAWILTGRANTSAADRAGCAAFLACLAGALASALQWPAERSAGGLWLLAAALATMLACAWGLAWAAGGLLKALRTNFHGMCSGRATATGNGAALTDWLHAYINDLAGLPPARPLTFSDLWGDDAAEDDDGDAAAAAKRSINLQVVTSAISQRTPYALPFRSGVHRWYLDPLEWEKLFPAEVLDYLHAAAPELRRVGDRSFLPLPRGGALPVIVAVRMSMSFPLLLSAVPLYAFDYTEKTESTPAPLKRVWFSDGGISSNLPLQFFDTLLPEHPTFAVNLKREHPRFRIDDKLDCLENGRAYLPRDNKAGRGLHWNDPSMGGDGILAFLAAILGTMQVWRDEVLFPYAGYRDRVVHVSLKEGEGGLHLDMDGEQVKQLAAAGACAAELLQRRFVPAAGEGWANHQEVRLISVLGNLETLALQAGAAAANGTWQAAVNRSQRLSDSQAALAHTLLAELQQMAADIAASGVRVADRMYRPSPSMKLGPNL